MLDDNQRLSEAQKKVLSVTEAAAVLQIGRNLCYRGIRRGEIPSIRVGTRLLVPVAALDRLLQQEWRQASPKKMKSGAD